MNDGTMITGKDTKSVEKIARNITSRPGNLSRASANAAIEWKSKATPVIVPATKKVFKTERTNANWPKMYRKFAIVGRFDSRVGTKTSFGSLKAAETIHTRG